MNKTELENKVRYHRYVYYNGNTEISDIEFDNLLDELKSKFPDSSVISEVGSNESSQHPKFKHKLVMGSQNKCHSSEEVLKALKNEKMHLSLKLDGCSGSAHYENGLLKHFVTRGNGTEGSDITRNVIEMQNLPFKLDTDFTGEIRGEIMLSNNEFKILLNNGHEFANARNACAGIIGSLNSPLMKHLSFHVFDCITDISFKTETDKLKYVKDTLHMTTTPYWESSKDSINKQIRELETERNLFGLLTDGLVFKIDDIEKQKSLGFVGKNPKGQIAFKYKAEEAETIINDIIFETGRTGKISPVAVFDPVQLSGTSVQKASLFNSSYIIDNNINVGTKVSICKSGEIIPIITKVIIPSLTPKEIKNCPSCTEELVYDDNKVAQWCKNDFCPAQVSKKILCFFTSQDIKSIGQATISKIVASGYHKLSDILKISETYLRGIGFGEKQSLIIFNAISKSKNCTTSQFLQGLGISALGNTLSTKYASMYGLDNILKMKTDELITEGVGTITALKIYTGLLKLEDEIQLLRKIVTVVDENNITSTEGILSNMVFCITGKFSKPRKELENIIKENGGKCVGSVTTNTTYLLQADKESNTSKSKKATKLGISIIDEDDFLELL